MPQTDNNEAFLFVTTPRSRSLILLLHERHTLLPKSSIFDSFWRIIIFGANWRKAYPTWSKPWKVRELGKIERRPPTREIITFLIAYRQLLTLKSKTKISTVFSWSSKISPNWKLNQTSNTFKFWTFLFPDRPNYSQLFEEYQENHSFVKGDQQEPSTATLFYLNQINC